MSSVPDLTLLEETVGVGGPFTIGHSKFHLNSMDGHSGRTIARLRNQSLGPMDAHLAFSDELAEDWSIYCRGRLIQRFRVSGCGITQIRATPD